MTEAQGKPLSPEELQQRNIAMRTQIMTESLLNLFNAAGVHPIVAIHAMSDAVQTCLVSIAKHDKDVAANVANELALSLVGLCRELGLTEDAEAANGAQA